METSGGILIEYQSIGNAMRVSAIDENTLTEVTFSVPSNTPEVQIENLARAKINYVLGKRVAEKSSNGPGIVV